MSFLAFMAVATVLLASGKLIGMTVVTSAEALKAYRDVESG
jgi:hypothetical protein